MAAPPGMVGLWALASVLRPGYDQLTQKGSELGTRPVGSRVTELAHRILADYIARRFPWLNTVGFMKPES